MRYRCFYKKKSKNKEHGISENNNHCLKECPGETDDLPLRIKGKIAPCFSPDPHFENKEKVSFSVSSQKEANEVWDIVCRHLEIGFNAEIKFTSAQPLIEEFIITRQKEIKE